MALAAALVAASPAAAGLDEALAAFGRGEFVAARAELEPLAQQGNAAAQYHLARMFDTGLGAARNDALAWSWYQRAAAARNVEAMVRVAEFSEAGRGVPLSLAAAVDMYGRAARAGHVGAMTRLGLMHLAGRGVKMDIPRAGQWLARAAALGDADAEAALAGIRARGIPVPAGDPALGETAPGDPAAKAALDAVKAMIAPLLRPQADGLVWRLGREPRVSPHEAGHVVLLHGVEGVGPQGRIAVGTVRCAVTAESPGRSRIGITLPGRLRVLDGKGAETAVLTLASHTIDVTWGADRVSGRMDFTYALTLAGVEFMPAERGGAMAADHLSATGRLTGADPAAWSRLPAQGAESDPLAVALGLAGLADGAESRVTVRNLRSQGAEGGGVVGRAELTAAVDGLRGAKASVHARLEAEGIAAPGTDFAPGSLPERIAVTLAADDLPTVTLAGTPGGARPSPAALLAGLAAGGSLLRLETAFGAAAYEVAVRGAGRPHPGSPFGLTAEALVQVRGLAAVLGLLGAHQPGPRDAATGDAALLAALRGAAEPGADAAGNRLDLFRLSLDPAGDLRVNGKPLAEALTAGLKAPQRPRP